MSDVLANAPSTNLAEVSVSQLAGAIKRTLEGAFERVRVRGELGRVTFHSNGHIYLDLKDDKACINCVVWRVQAHRLKLKPEEGLEVIATGRITTYAPRSSYQLVIEELELAGEGALMALLDKRRKALAAEGLFDEARKKKLPFLPEVIGVVTSPTGAVIRDILHRLRERFPRRVILWPVVVQGERAAGEVAAAIAGFNRLAPGGAVPRPDLLIVARGGGSIEDLWAFNEEIVVRAAAASEIPLISAVGHETDTTLIDFAADRRAPTPTAAAEMAVPVRLDLAEETLALGRRLLQAVRRLVVERKRYLEGLTRALARPEDLVSVWRQRLDSLAHRLPQALRSRAAASEARFNRVAGRMRPGLLTTVLRAHRRSLAQVETRFARSFARHMRQERASIDRARLRVGALAARLNAAEASNIARARAKFAACARLIEGLSFERTLERGFALISDRSGHILRAGAAAARAGDVEIRFKGDDRVAARILGPHKIEPEAPAAVSPRQGKLL